MTADDVRGEDYEAAKPTATRSRVTGDPWQNRTDSGTHLPECAERRAEWRWSEDCICDRLRACEQRVRGEVFDGHHRYYQQVRTDALQAAREAVADCRVPWPTVTGDLVNEGIDDALAAIDALRADHA